MHEQWKSGFHVLVLTRKHPEDEQALVAAHIERAVDSSCAECWDAEALQRDCVGKVEARDLRRYLQFDEAIADDLANELQADAKLPVLQRDSCLVGTTLHNRNW